MAATLQAKLDAMRAGSAKRIPEDSRAIMHAHTQRLIESGQAERALGEGDPAPQFGLLDTAGQPWRSPELLQRGPLVVTFFRGHW